MTVLSFPSVMNKLFNSFIKRGSSRLIRFNSSASSSSNVKQSTNSDTISYMQSKVAKNYKAADGYFVYPDQNEVWPSNPRVFSFCCLMIGIYCMFREANDLDEQFDKPIFDRLPHLERPILESSLINSYNQGLPTQHIVERLKELEAEGK
ncbi:uncharacterized protein LOC128393691 [Panonychus citri]|uniref:uncharacterized protein LOC128393691 n=1 Tax=Panonychus citri TaxID=50023 RepID=UPI0023071C3A|nr:uncharacterized protein LOC128393691 [Panonychus citri]